MQAEWWLQQAYQDAILKTQRNVCSSRGQQTDNPASSSRHITQSSHSINAINPASNWSGRQSGLLASDPKTQNVPAKLNVACHTQHMQAACCLRQAYQDAILKTQRDVCSRSRSSRVQHHTSIIRTHAALAIAQPPISTALQPDAGHVLRFGRVASPV
jgi:hypothetical protein